MPLLSRGRSSTEHWAKCVFLADLHDSPVRAKVSISPISSVTGEKAEVQGEAWALALDTELRSGHAGPGTKPVRLQSPPLRPVRLTLPT